MTGTIKSYNNDFPLIRIATDIPAHTDLNTITTVGSYRIRSYGEASGMTNMPYVSAGALYVKNGMLENNVNYKQQIYLAYDCNVFIRHTSDAGVTWSAWKKFAFVS